MFQSFKANSFAADVAHTQMIVVQFEFLLIYCMPFDGVILSAAVLQTERRISRYDASCHERSLGPLMKTRALRDDAMRDLRNSNCTTIRRIYNLYKMFYCTVCVRI